jgi:hypothetical protein
MFIYKHVQSIVYNVCSQSTFGFKIRKEKKVQI